MVGGLLLAVHWKLIPVLCGTTVVLSKLILVCGDILYEVVFLGASRYNRLMVRATALQKQRSTDSAVTDDKQNKGPSCLCLQVFASLSSSPRYLYRPSFPIDLSIGVGCYHEETTIEFAKAYST